ncbi:hypothetical protein F5X68DRAFT_200184 [Plectosphaerella plurivora]|uniref:Uncharacterized protein n=1 Tax=Plectosphaerella plurivora TaxID=936078 RepID=A0A9P8VI20_9PEZI|nr:hypothetical protein F5X68DRAFT_200184 [Plectosphaerella plurivora]
MSAPTRGLALRPVCRRQTLQPFVLPSSRTFASLPPKSTLTSKINLSPKPPKPKASGAGKVPLSAATLQNPVLLQLARAKSSTLLYESASHFWMKLSAWSTAITCYTGAGINFYLATTAEGLAWFIPPIYTATSLALAGMGSFFIFGAANIVKSIRAVPTSLMKGGPPSTINPGLTPVHIEVAIKPLLPFRTTPTVITVPPEKLSLGRALYTPTPSEKMVREAELQAKLQKKAQWEKDKQHLMTLPFRDAWRYSKMAFHGVKRALTGGGFVKINVGDRKCKLDMATGWALNDGKTLEALASVQGSGVPKR